MPVSLSDAVRNSISENAKRDPIKTLLAATWAFLFTQKAFVALILLI